MIERGELEHVTPSPTHAKLLMDQAEAHFASAQPLVAIDPPSAYTLLYDGARKSLTALLATQGLRPTRTGGHIAVQLAAEAQLGPNTKHLVRAFGVLRRRRNESEYPSADEPPVTREEARDGCDDARQIIDVAQRLLPHLGPYQR
jgi:hypothetical protein